MFSRRCGTEKGFDWKSVTHCRLLSSTSMNSTGFPYMCTRSGVSSHPYTYLSYNNLHREGKGTSSVRVNDLTHYLAAIITAHMHYPTNELLVAPNIYTITMLPWQPSRPSQGNNLEDTHKCHCYTHKKYKQQNLSATAVRNLATNITFFDITCTYTVHISSSISQLEGKVYCGSYSYVPLFESRVCTVWQHSEADVNHGKAEVRG